MAPPARYLPAILRAFGLVEKADGSRVETIMRYSLARAAVKEQTVAVGGKEAPVG